MHWKDRDHFVLSSGREVGANRGIIGINRENELYEGYDGDIVEANADPAWTPEERTELAEYMIQRWTEYRDAVTQAVCATNGHQWGEWLGFVHSLGEPFRLRRCQRCMNEEIKHDKFSDGPRTS